MSQLLDSYRNNALAARRDAKQSNLPNVRQRAAEAAEVWERLADSLEQVESGRQEREARSVPRVSRYANP